MAVGPFSVTQPKTLQTQLNPIPSPTYVVTRDQTQPNIEHQHNVVQIAKNVTHTIQMFNSCQLKL